MGDNGVGGRKEWRFRGGVCRKIRRTQTSDIWVIGTDRESGTPRRLN